MGAHSTAAASVAHDPELIRLIEQYVARRRRERLRQAVERSLAERLLGEAQPQRRPGPHPPVHQLSSR
ncbi:hypothetical protein GCM10010347_52810 [Streptomyces cirratus]|uniref:Uncharacterized protein n=1 Tax=Streptomyces cirratus TaxID=68187 RepID=A0ABQ3EZ54_9ACTN|nr:hypothetical protein [Streptomyces cirratus]GHB75779.1 hypothetical protein GCM10010347_52810 [Streptomyces cirratus]